MEEIRCYPQRWPSYCMAPCWSRLAYGMSEERRDERTGKGELLLLLFAYICEGGI